jgi:C-terminal processing protease CtpA/Prc
VTCDEYSKVTEPWNFTHNNVLFFFHSLCQVVDTPNGGVPVVRAIKPDSVLTGRVQVGDRLISVDHQDVTSMSALEVSSLISLKQNSPRLLVFVRLPKK